MCHRHKCCQHLLIAEIFSLAPSGGRGVSAIWLSLPGTCGERTEFAPVKLSKIFFTEGDSYIPLIIRTFFVKKRMHTMKVSIAPVEMVPYAASPLQSTAVQRFHLRLRFLRSHIYSCLGSSRHRYVWPVFRISCSMRRTIPD